MSKNDEQVSHNAAEQTSEWGNKGPPYPLAEPRMWLCRGYNAKGGPRAPPRMREHVPSLACCRVSMLSRVGITLTPATGRLCRRQR